MITILQTLLAIYELFSIFLIYLAANSFQENFIFEEINFLGFELDIMQLGFLIFLIFSSKPLVTFLGIKKINYEIFHSWSILTEKISFTQIRLKSDFDDADRLSRSYSSLLITELPLAYTSFVIPFTNAITEIFTLIILASFLLFLDWMPALIAIASIGLVFLIVNFATRKKIVQIGQDRESFEDKRVRVLRTLIENKQELKIFDGAANQIKNLNQSLKKISDSWSLNLALAQIPKSSLELGAILAATSSILFLIFYLERSLLDIAAFAVTTAFIVLRLVPGVNKIILGFQYARFMNETVEKIISNTNLNFDEEVPSAILQESEINFINVENFQLPNGKFISFFIEGNGLYSLKAPSGYGKSYFIKCILGLFKYEKGSIKLGKKINSEISYMPQDVTIWFGTLADNLLFEKGRKEENLAIELLTKLDMKNWFDSLPFGFETIMSEEDLKISGGQKARLCFIRQLIKDPAILFLDEFTANLDLDSKQKILKVCKEFAHNSLILCATHDDETLKASKKIIDFQNISVEHNN